MCLYVDVDSHEMLLEKYQKKDIIRGYKVLYRPKGKGGRFYGTFTRKIWRKTKTGMHNSSRKDTKLTNTERQAPFWNHSRLSVYEGFHFFRTREVARDSSYDSIHRPIVAFEINTKDLVAFSYNEEQFVATKAKWIKEVR